MVRRIKQQLIYSAVVLILLVAVIISVNVMVRQSPTWDEPTYIAAGYYFLKTNDPSMMVGHPILVKELSAFPLLFLNPALPENSSSYVQTSYVDFGYQFLFVANHNADQLVFWSRIPFIAIFVLLGIYVFTWSKELFGNGAGIAALILYSFSPTVLGHAGLAITDLLVAAFFTISSYHLWRFANSRKKSHIVLAGISFGFAHAAKLTAIYMYPIFFLLLAFAFYHKPLGWPRNIKNRLLCSAGSSLSILLAISIIASAILFVLYGFQFGTLENSAPQRYFEQGYNLLPEKLLPAARFTVENVPIPFPSYFSGYAIVAFASVTPIKESFLNGVSYMGGKPEYFFLEFLLKSPLPFLILLALAAFSIRWAKFRSKLDLYFLLLPPLFLFLVFLPSQYNSGIRHLMPMFPFLFIFICSLFTVKFLKQRLTKLLKIAFAILLVWYVIDSAVAYPHYFAYFNEMVEPGNAHRHFVDANLDLGQDLKGLKAWMDSNGVKSVNLSYFGTADPAYYGINYDYIPSPVWQPWVPGYAPLESMLLPGYTEDCSSKKGIVAISATNLQSVYLLNRTCFDWLKSYEPIGDVGHSIFIYNITD